MARPSAMTSAQKRECRRRLMLNQSCEQIGYAMEIPARTVRRYAATRGHRRFRWSEPVDSLLKQNWTRMAPERLAHAIGCSVRAVYKRAGELKLPPRDPVQRAIREGAPLTRGISLAPVGQGWSP